MQLYTSLGRPWNLMIRPFFKILMSRFPIEFVTLFTFIFIAQQFINKSSYAIILFVVWMLLIYFIYLIRSHCNLEQFNCHLNLDIDEIIEIFHLLPNFNLFQNDLLIDQSNSIEWINWFLSNFWTKLSIFLNRKFRKQHLTLIKFFTLENPSVGIHPPIIESLNSNLFTHNHQDTLIINFDFYWFARSSIDSSIDSFIDSSIDSSIKSTKSNGDEYQSLFNLKLFGYTIGSLKSFCLKANCQIRIRFMQWQLNEDKHLKDIDFSFTYPPKLHYLDTSGLIWLFDNLQLIRPIIHRFLNQQFLYPKHALFKFKPSSKQEIHRRPQIGCPVALFCIDVIQAENIPIIKNKKQRTDYDELDKKSTKTKKQTQNFDLMNANQTEENNDDDPVKPDSSKGKGFSLFNCFNHRLPSVFCKVRIFNQQFISPPIMESTNPFWNFRSFVPIFSHNKHSIEQLEKYHALYQTKQESNPVDLNASFYQFPMRIQSQSPEQISDNQMINLKKFISFDLLENLSITIQLIDKQDQINTMIAKFQINDPSQYFLDAEFNGQSQWINSTTTGVQANVDQSIKLNLRFTFLTLNQILNPNILSNAYLANRLAFPIGVLLVFVDSAIGLNAELLKRNLNAKNNDYGFQIVCQLGNRSLHTSISTDLSFIWENELLFCVYSLNLEKLIIKLVARGLNSIKFDLITIATTKLDLSSLINQTNLVQQHYVPIVIKPNRMIYLKLLLNFRIIHFTTKLISNCLRNPKVAEEDVLVRDKQIFIDEKLKLDLDAKKINLKDEEQIIKKTIEDADLNDSQLVADSIDETEQSTNSIDKMPMDSHLSHSQKVKMASEKIHIIVSVRMRWPKPGKLVIEIVDLRCAKFLSLFQMYSMDVYLNCVLRDKEKALQSKRTKNFQLKTSIVQINQELKFNCITKLLAAYHLNISLHEKRTEEFSKIAELYTPLPQLQLASGQIDKQFALNLTTMFLKTSGINEMRTSTEYDGIDRSVTRDNDRIQINKNE